MTVDRFLRGRADALAAAVDAFLDEQQDALTRAADALAGALAGGGTLFLCGNGGSAAHALHFEAELLGRYDRERRPVPSIYLGAGTSTSTAVANDYGVDHMFSRPLEALGKPGDALLALSTSGTSPNIISAIGVAREKGIPAVLMSGPKADLEAADVVLRFPGDGPDRIQEGHQLLVHALMDAIERAL